MRWLGSPPGQLARRLLQRLSRVRRAGPRGYDISAAHRRRMLSVSCTPGRHFGSRGRATTWCRRARVASARPRRSPARGRVWSLGPDQRSMLSDLPAQFVPAAETSSGSSLPAVYLARLDLAPLSLRGCPWIEANGELAAQSRASPSRREAGRSVALCPQRQTSNVWKHSSSQRRAQHADGVDRTDLASSMPLPVAAQRGRGSVAAAAVMSTASSSLCAVPLRRSPSGWAPPSWLPGMVVADPITGRRAIAIVETESRRCDDLATMASVRDSHPVLGGGLVITLPRGVRSTRLLGCSVIDGLSGFGVDHDKSGTGRKCLAR